MDILGSLAAIVFAALIHGGFQLSISVLTLLSGHALGAKRSEKALRRLSAGFIGGAAVMTLLAFATGILLTDNIAQSSISKLSWSILSGLLIGLGLAVWLFYYRHTAGTSLWLPRNMARYLAERAKDTRSAAEAFGLGLASVASEFIFILAPVIVASSITTQLSTGGQTITALIIYTLVASLPLMIVWGLISGGHSISKIQRWRAENKRFLQLASGGGLIVLGFYIYVSEVVAVAALNGGGI